MGARSYQRWDEPPPPEYGGGSAPGLPSPPLATKRLLWANVLAFVPVFGIWLFATDTYARVLDVLGLSPETWQRWMPWLPVWQLGTYSFLHAVRDPLHLVFNLLGLYFFGSMLERRLGAQRFLLTYFGAVAFGALVFLAAGLAQGNYVPAVGASGGVLGVLVACAVLEPHAPIYLFPLPIAIPLRWLALGYAALQLLSAAIDVKSGGGSGVAYLIHLGGMAFGFAAVKTGLVSFDASAWWAARRRRVEVESGVRDDERLDQLLERINREGIGKLSSADRSFLKRMSGRTKRP
ncbi:MAG: rhomboid family intramembrane serine protease [Planctomycetota bacterium]|nr:MAG: rhomboid family intramembrane serine protease [Planctomycetota bacterium]